MSRCLLLPHRRKAKYRGPREWKNASLSDSLCPSYSLAFSTTLSHLCVCVCVYVCVCVLRGRPTLWSSFVGHKRVDRPVKGAHSPSCEAKVEAAPGKWKIWKTQEFLLSSPPTILRSYTAGSGRIPAATPHTLLKWQSTLQKKKWKINKIEEIFLVSSCPSCRWKSNQWRVCVCVSGGGIRSYSVPFIRFFSPPPNVQPTRLSSHLTFNF